MTVIFFNPYADLGVKGAARRIEFLRHLLDLQGVPNQAVLAQEYAAAPKSMLERLVLGLRLRRVAYFLHALRLCRLPGHTVISEVIFTPTWHANMILTVHDLKAYDTRATRGGLARRWAYRVFTRLASRIVVVSESVRLDMQRLCSAPPARIHVVPNGISQKRLDLAKSFATEQLDFDFIYVSSFAHHKRHALLLRAAPPGSRVCLVGRDLGSLEETRTVAATRGNNVTIDIRTDVSTDEELFQLICRAKCGVFPSVFEGFGIPLLEYAAAGLYVIASEIPPFRELSDYVDAFVPPDDEHALHDALVTAQHQVNGHSREAVTRVAQGAYTESAISRQLFDVIGIARD